MHNLSEKCSACWWQ